MTFINQYTQWNKGTIINELKTVANELGYSPSNGKLKEIGRRDLADACSTYFGTFNKAKQSAGLKITLAQKWNNKKVIEELQNISKETNLNISNNFLENIGRRDLVEACYIYFGSFNEAKRKAGLDIYGWNKEKIIKEFVKFKIGPDVSIRNLKSSDKEYLLHAAIKHFGSWNNFRRQMGWKVFDNTYKLPITAEECSQELGYIIGVCLGDGYIYKKGIALKTIDKDFAYYFADKLNKWSGKKAKITYRNYNSYMISPTNKKKYKQKGCYYVLFISVKASEFLCNKLYNERYYTPAKNRTLNINWIYNTNEDFKRSIVRGLFDSEGSISNIRNGLHLTFYNSNIEIINLFKYLCDYLCIPLIIYKNKSPNLCYHLHTYILNNIVQFYHKIGITIKRKRIKIEEKIENGG